MGTMSGAGAASTAMSGARGLASMFSSFRPIAMSMRFSVRIGEPSDPQYDLGEWTSCEGLKVEFKYEEIRSGGDYGQVYAMPQQVVYPQVTLKRAVERQKSDTVQDWLQDVADEWMDGTGGPYEGSFVNIELHDVMGMVAASWLLDNAFPSSWTGPSLSAKGTDVASETLVLNHSGFLRPE
jgi:phage tail-like protein